MISSAFLTCSSSSWTFSRISARSRRRASSGSVFLPGPCDTLTLPDATVFTVYNRWPTAPTSAPLANTRIKDKNADNLDLGMGTRLLPGQLYTHRRYNFRRIQWVGLRQSIDIALRVIVRARPDNGSIDSKRDRQRDRSRYECVSHPAE